MPQVDDTLIGQLRELLGERGVRTEPDDVLDFFKLGPFIPFDVSVTVDQMQAFIADVRAGADTLADPICIIFGHIGDCNLHVLLGNRDPDEFDPDRIQSILYDAVEVHRGSVSAEHGVGLSKRDQLHRSRNDEELQLMVSLKKMLDPKNILNPNKIFAADRIAAA